MDRYAKLINDLQDYLDEIKIEIKQLEDEKLNLKGNESKLKGRIYIAQNLVESLKCNLNHINNADSRYANLMKKSLFVVFLISFIANALINNFLGIAVLQMTIDSLVTSSLFTLVAGVAEKYVIMIKKDFLNKYEKAECEQGINHNRTNIKNLEKELEQNSIKLNETEEQLKEKNKLKEEIQNRLTEYKTKRTAILDELIGQFIDKEVDVNPTLDVPSFQIVMKQIKSNVDSAK